MAKGLDIGTAFLVAAKFGKKNEIEYTTYRDAFLQVDQGPHTKQMLEKSKASFIEANDRVYILGEDAIGLATVFRQEVRRPLSKGVISPKERDAVVILKAILSTILKEPVSPGEKVVFSCPADPWDENYNTVFHKGVFTRILQELGYTPTALTEGLAIVFSELADKDFTGIGFSFGAGMVNVCLAYHSVEVMSFSIAKAGDYIDENAARSVGVHTPKIMRLKEAPDFDLLAPKSFEEEAIAHYYKSLISFVVKGIKTKLEVTELPDFGKKITAVISGGTSKPKGVMELIQTELANTLPFEIEQIRAAEDQLKATAKGCLIAASL